MTECKSGVYGSSRCPITPIGGIVIYMVNGTGQASVKGSLVSASTSADNKFILQSNEYDTIGIVYDNGIADGGKCRIVIAGIAEVLFKDTVAATRGNVLIAADTDGRGTGIANPGSGLPATDTHFKECGHVLESKDAGTNVLVKCIVHFN